MAKRRGGIGSWKSHSHKTKKRLAIKQAMLEAKKGKGTFKKKRKK